MYTYEESDFDRWLGVRSYCYPILSWILSTILIYLQMYNMPKSELESWFEFARFSLIIMFLWMAYILGFAILFLGLEYLIFKAHERYKENKEQPHND